MIPLNDREIQLSRASSVPSFLGYHRVYAEKIAHTKALQWTQSVSRAVEIARMEIQNINRAKEIVRLEAQLQSISRAEEITRMNARHKQAIQSTFLLDRAYESISSTMRLALLPTEQSKIHSTAYGLVSSASLSLSRILPPLEAMEKISKETTWVTGAWEAYIRSSQKSLDILQSTELAFQSHIAKSASISIAVEMRLAQISFEKIGETAHLSIAKQMALQRSFVEFTESYSHLYKSIEQHPAKIASFPPVVSSLPPVELFTVVESLASISTVPVNQRALPVEAIAIGREIINDTASSLEKLLSDIDLNLIRLWRGAKNALKSKNPDRVRHFATSLRELFTHVLHTIAPDTEIKKWTSDPNNYHNGCPTRHARLLYLCRKINYGPFTTFVQKDVASDLAFLSLFQTGTHAVRSDFSEHQLLAMLARMESLLRFLLEIAKQDN